MREQRAAAARPAGAAKGTSACLRSRWQALQWGRGMRACVGMSV